MRSQSIQGGCAGQDDEWPKCPAGHARARPGPAGRRVRLEQSGFLCSWTLWSPNNPSQNAASSAGRPKQGAMVLLNTKRKITAMRLLFQALQPLFWAKSPSRTTCEVPSTSNRPESSANQSANQPRLPWGVQTTISQSTRADLGLVPLFMASSVSRAAITARRSSTAEKRRALAT